MEYWRGERKYYNNDNIGAYIAKKDKRTTNESLLLFLKLR